jgi:hypothetical protein
LRRGFISVRWVGEATGRLGDFVQSYYI